MNAEEELCATQSELYIFGTCLLPPCLSLQSTATARITSEPLRVGTKMLLLLLQEVSLTHGLYL